MEKVSSQSSLAFICNPAGQVLILREGAKFAAAPAAPCWDVPGGRIKPGETMADCLRQRVFEETGYTLVDTPAEPFMRQTYTFTEGGKFWEVEGQCFILPVAGLDVRLGPTHDQFLWVDPYAHADHALFPNLHAVFAAYLQHQKKAWE